MTAAAEENLERTAEETDERSRHRERPVLLALLLVLLVACCWIALSQTGIVPNVVGMTEQQAREAAELAGFSLETSAVPEDGTLAAGLVSGQSPRPGMRALRGTTMLVSIPGSLEGEGQTGVGISSGGEGWLPPATGGAGTGEGGGYDGYIPGSAATGGTGPLVPAVGNKTEAEAIAALTAAGYRPVVGGYGPTTAGVTIGHVYYQSPAPDSRLGRGSTVVIWVSTGPPHANGYEGVPYPGPANP